MGTDYIKAFTPGYVNFANSNKTKSAENTDNATATVTAEPVESFEEAERRRRKEGEERVKANYNNYLAALEKTKSLELQIEQMKAATKESREIIERAEKGTVAEDGTIKDKDNWDNYANLPLYKQLLRNADNLVQGGWKVASKLFGYEINEETGERKWNPVKLGINVAITAGCLALCVCTAPVSLPVIGATTVGALASGSLLTLGIGSAAYGTYKGAVNINEAIKKKDLAALDKGCQDLGEGLTIGAATVAGARTMGASLESTAASNTAASITRTTSNNPLTKLSNFLTRTEYLKGDNWFSQYFYDSTINASRSIAYSGSKGRLDYTNNGFLKSTWSNMKDFIPKNGKTKMDNAKNNTNNGIDSRLEEIEQQLHANDINPFMKALLEDEKNFLNAQKTEIASTGGRSAWQRLKSDSKAHQQTEKLENSINDMQSNGSLEIGGTSFDANTDNLMALQKAQIRSKNLSKEIENLVKVRRATIKKMAYLSKFKDEVEAYTGIVRSSRLGRIYDTSKILKSDITFGKCVTAPFKALLCALGLEFKPWIYIQKSPASTAFKVQETIANDHTEGMLSSEFLADITGIGAQTQKQKIPVQNEKGEIVEQEVVMTKDILAQLKEGQKKDEDTIAQIEKEIKELYQMV